jgi:hypothetical protein
VTLFEAFSNTYGGTEYTTNILVRMGGVRAMAGTDYFPNIDVTASSNPIHAPIVVNLKIRTFFNIFLWPYERQAHYQQLVQELYCGVALRFLYTATSILTYVRFEPRDASRVVTPSPGEPRVVNISLAWRPEVLTSVAYSTSSRLKSSLCNNEMWRDPFRKLAQTFSVSSTCVPGSYF